MANQMIALQARAPQTGGLGNMVQQNAALMNMMTQQAAAQRQAQQAQQGMDFAANEEARKAALHTPAMAKASAEAGNERLKYVTDFLSTSATALSNVRNAQEVQAVAGILREHFPDMGAALDQELSSLPSDPAQFEDWRKRTLFQTMKASDQLSQHFENQTNGEQTWTNAMPMYAGGGGGAAEVAGSRAEAPQGITYVKDANGQIIPMPKTMPAGGTGAPTPTGGADVVYGNGKYGSPPVPLSTMPMSAVQQFQRDTLIPATRGKVGAGADKGTGAVGTYQITYGTLKKYAPQVFGQNWQAVPFSAENQDKLAEAIYEDAKHGDLHTVWAGMPSNAAGAYSNVPWSQARTEIAKVESGGSGGGVQMGQPFGPTTPPKTGPTTEDERKIASNVRNMLSASRELAAAVQEDASAMAPGGGEYAAGMIPFYGSEAAQWMQSGARQRFNSALEKILAGVTFINTGAGVSETQMNSYRKSYFPTIQDTPRTRQQKMLGVIQFIRDAKVRAGNAWTPELDASLNQLQNLFGKAATFGSAPTASAGRASSGVRVTKVAD